MGRFVQSSLSSLHDCLINTFRTPPRRTLSVSGIERYFSLVGFCAGALSPSFLDLNPTGPFDSYRHYLVSFLCSYVNLILDHSSAGFLLNLVGPLGRLVQVLENRREECVRRLDTVRGRWRHNDLHWGNILYDQGGV